MTVVGEVSLAVHAVAPGFQAELIAIGDKAAAAAGRSAGRLFAAEFAAGAAKAGTASTGMFARMTSSAREAGVVSGRQYAAGFAEQSKLTTATVAKAVGQGKAAARESGAVAGRQYAAGFAEASKASLITSTALPGAAKRTASFEAQGVAEGRALARGRAVGSAEGNALSTLGTRGGRIAETVAEREGGRAGRIYGQAFGKSSTPAIAAVVVLAASAKVAGDFQQDTNVLVTAAKELPSNLGIVRKGILDTATLTGTKISEVTDATYDAEKAGYRGAEANEVVRASAQAAREENAKLKTVTGGLTTTMYNYGGKAVQTANALKTASAVSKTTFEQFTSGLGNFESRAKAAGISLPDALGVYSAITQQGLTAQRASQNLGQTIQQLSNPTQTMIDAFGRYGISITDFTDKLGSGPGKRGLSGSLEYLNEQIVNQLGPNNKVLLNTFNTSKIAAHAADVEFKALPPDAKRLAQGVMDGTESLAAFRKDSGKLPAVMGNLARSWQNTYLKANDFQALIKRGGPEAQPYLAAMRQLLGGQQAVSVALAATGNQAATTKGRVDSIADSYAHAGKEVEGWKSTSKLFNVQFDRFKQSITRTGIEIGNKLLPVLSKVFGFFADHPDFAKTAIEGLLLLGGVAVLGKIGGLIGTLGRLTGVIRGVGAASTVTAGEVAAVGAAGGAGRAGGVVATRTAGSRVMGLVKGAVITYIVVKAGDAILKSIPGYKEGDTNYNDPGDKSLYAEAQRNLHNKTLNDWTLGAPALVGNIAEALIDAAGGSADTRIRKKYAGTPDADGVVRSSKDPVLVEAGVNTYAELAEKRRQAQNFDVPGKAANYAPGYEPGGKNYMPSIGGKNPAEQYLRALDDAKVLATAKADGIGVATEKGLDTGRVKAGASGQGAVRAYLNSLAAGGPAAQQAAQDGIVKHFLSALGSAQALAGEAGAKVTKAATNAMTLGAGIGGGQAIPGQSRNTAAAAERDAKAFDNTAQAAQLATSAVSTYIGTAGSIPPAKTTKITADTAIASGAVFGFIGAANSVPPAKGTKVTADVGGAVGNLALVQAYLQSLQDKYVSVIVETINRTVNESIDIGGAKRTARGGLAGRARGGLTRFAAGGLLKGPGTPTSDSILGLDEMTGAPTTWVSTDEYVVNAKATKKNLGLLEYINRQGLRAGGAVSGVLGGLAKGGKPKEPLLPGTLTTATQAFKAALAALAKEANAIAKIGVTGVLKTTTTDIKAGQAAIAAAVKQGNGPLQKQLASQLKTAQGKLYATGLNAVRDKVVSPQEAIQIKAAANNVEALTKQLTKLNTVNEGLIDKLKSFVDAETSVRDNIRSSVADGRGLDNVLAASGTAGDVKSQLASNLGDVRTFQSKILELKKRGFSNAIVREVADDGIVNGIQYADLLLSASRADVKGINAGYAAVEGAETSGANAITKATQGAIPGLSKAGAGVYIQQAIFTAGANVDQLIGKAEYLQRTGLAPGQTAVARPRPAAHPAAARPATTDVLPVRAGNQPPITFQFDKIENHYEGVNLATAHAQSTRDLSLLLAGALNG